MHNISTIYQFFVSHWKCYSCKFSTDADLNYIYDISHLYRYRFQLQIYIYIYIYISYAT